MTEMTPAYRYRAIALRVIDGDTFVADVDLGFHTHVHQHIRLHGYNAPELRTPDGPGARARLQAALAGEPLVLQTYRDVQSFERWVADVWVGGCPVRELLEAMK